MSARVLHVVVAGEIGGAERMVVDLASRPEESGAAHAVAVMTPNVALVRMMREAGLLVFDRGPVRENPAAYLWRSLGPVDVAWLVRVVAEWRAGIVHLHTFGSQVIGTRAARRAGARVVRTEHSTRVYVDPSCWPFSRWSLGRTDRVVAISAHIRETVLDKAPWATSRVRVVHDGVDTGHFSPRAAADFAGEGRPFRFVTVARLDPRKGIDLAVEAVAQTPGVLLDVVGDGDERSNLERLARRLGVTDRVTFHGFVADPRDLVASADLALCTSREEGLGIALLEAMAMERPALAVAVGGVPESVEDGKTGFLVRERTVKAIAGRMRQLSIDRPGCRALGPPARERVVAKFSVTSMRRAYGAVYRELLPTP